MKVGIYHNIYLYFKSEYFRSSETKLVKLIQIWSTGESIFLHTNNQSGSSLSRIPISFGRVGFSLFFLMGYSFFFGSCSNILLFVDLDVWVPDKTRTKQAGRKLNRPNLFLLSILCWVLFSGSVLLILDFFFEGLFFIWSMAKLEVSNGGNSAVSEGKPPPLPSPRRNSKFLQVMFELFWFRFILGQFRRGLNYT